MVQIINFSTIILLFFTSIFNNPDQLVIKHRFKEDWCILKIKNIGDSIAEIPNIHSVLENGFLPKEDYKIENSILILTISDRVKPNYKTGHKLYDSVHFSGKYNHVYLLPKKKATFKFKLHDINEKSQINQIKLNSKFKSL